MMSVSTVRSSVFSLSLWRSGEFAMTPRCSFSSEWIVCPPTFSAATPVGAVMTMFFEVRAARWFRSVDLPVPARPVMKRWSRVFSMRSKSTRCSSESTTTRPG